MNKILMAGGGTLGSVTPLIAIAHEFPEADYLFLTTKKGPESQFIRARGIRVISLPAGKWRRYFSWRNFTDLFKIIAGFFRSLIIISSYKPDLILTAGGFVAVPVVWAGRILGKKIFVHQQDLEIGLANKLMAPAATIITVSFAELVAFFPNKKVIVTGNPARHLKTETSELVDSILILGGSQGARPMNEFINQSSAEWCKQYPVNHVLGATNLGQKASVAKNYQAFGFVDQELPALLDTARLVITRGGIATLTELAALGKPCIIIPMPNTHQEANARFFADKHAALVVNQGDTEALNQAVEMIMNDQVMATTLARNLTELFNPHANNDYVKLLKESLALSVEANPRVYLAGIGGIGLSALAEYFLQQNYAVIGSDLTSSTVTKRLEQQGIQIHYQQKRGNIPEDCSLFIYSSALPANNEEIVEAKKRHIPMYTYNEYLGLLSRQKETIAISGTHGKTTTTGLVGLMLTEANLDPTIIVGGLIPQLEGNFRGGLSDYLVVEACEYRSHMLELAPKIIALTNIEEDHLDYFRNLDHIIDQFQRFVDSLPAEGLLVRNADDKNSKRLTVSQSTITIGIDNPADYQATNLQLLDQQQTFTLLDHGKSVGEFIIRIPGKFNIYNSLLALAIARHLAVPYEVIRKTLSEYRGSWRRFEKVGSFHDLPVYSDYAHHPTEISSTIEAAKLFYPKKKIFVIFQPHSYSRTESLFARFSQAFDQADKVIIMQTYKVAGREDDVEETGLASHLAQEIGSKAHYAETFDQAKQIIAEQADKQDLILFMGAGDVDSLARSMIERV